MIPPRLLTFALFSSALVAAVWWQRQRSQPRVSVIKARREPEYPWTDLT